MHEQKKSLVFLLMLALCCPLVGQGSSGGELETTPQAVEVYAIEIAGGDAQRGAVDSLLGRSLRLRVRGADGEPVADASVQWTVVFGDATLVAGGLTTTGGDGIASNRLRLGARLGLVRVTARVVGAERSVFFTATVVSALDPIQTTFEQACDDDLAALDGLCGYVDGLSDDDQERVLEELEPDELAAQATVLESIARSRQLHLVERLAAHRRGDARRAFDGLRLRVDGEAASWAEDGAVEERASGDRRRLGLFVSGALSTGERPLDVDEAGFDLDLDDLMLGVDYRLGEHAVLGGALSVARADAEFFDRGGALEADGEALSLFVQAVWERGVYVQAVAGVGRADLEQTRAIDLPVALRGRTRYVATGATESDEVSLFAEVGWDRRLRSELEVTGFVRAAWLEATLDAYRESGDPDGAGLYLEFLEQEIESLQVETGVDLAWPIARPWGMLTPRLRFSGVRELEGDDRVVRARFLADPRGTLLRLPTAEPDENFFRLGLGLSAQLRGGFAAYLQYDTDLERSDLTLDTLSVGVRLSL
ncbi:MAG: autotransporter outer membrane beta-barrel domain-containing protein [Acidobacteriota bacterium]